MPPPTISGLSRGWVVALLDRGIEGVAVDMRDRKSRQLGVRDDPRRAAPWRSAAGDRRPFRSVSSPCRACASTPNLAVAIRPGSVMPKTVMIVEDNELNMKLFNDLLEANGYSIIQTRNGMEALAWRGLTGPTSS
jgi:hypothetical protein